MAMDHQETRRMTDPHMSGNSSKRRRVPEACHACRKRKAKCDGLRPCGFCKQNNVECVFDAQMVPLGTVEQSLLYLPESVKLLSDRVANIEQYLRDASDRDRVGRLSPKFRDSRQNSLDDSEQSKSDQHLIEPGGEGVTAVANIDESRSTEYYGATSTVAIASDLYQAATSPVASQKPGTSPPSTRRIDDLSGIDALLNPATASTEDYTPRKPVTSKLDDIANKPIADRHLANYFATIHTLIPVLHEGAFRALYNNYWSRLSCESSSPQPESNLRKITAPLIYSVLALGALYEDGYNDHAFWAKEWFAKGREGINNAVEECCFEICLAVYFLAGYSQHVIKPNLAYNLLGLAIRLAYSIGLNRSSVSVAYSETAWPGVGKPVVTEMCKRIWWQMYVIEVEIALDSGRPMCIRNSDIDVELPVEMDDKNVSIDQTIMVAQVGPSKVTYLIALSRFSRIIRKVLKVLFPVKKKTLTLPALTEALVDFDRQFSEWRDNLPPHLVFAHPNSYMNDFSEPSWITRARVAMHCHFNHVYIVMHRPLLTVPHFSTPFLSSEASNEIGMNAAKENITLIHSALQHDPPLRKWVYYCYYNFMAELVFLTMLIKQPFAEEAREWAAVCNMAIESFEWMIPLLAAKKSRTMSKTFVDEWKAKVQAGHHAADGVSSNKRRRSHHHDTASRIQSNISNTSSPQINYLLQPPQNTFQQQFVPPGEFQTPVHISPQSDASYSPLNPTRYDLQQSAPYSTTQTLDAAAAETLQSFSGTGWPNQAIFAGDGAMGWTYNFEDLFGDLSGNLGGQRGM